MRGDGLGSGGQLDRTEDGCVCGEMEGICLRYSTCGLRSERGGAVSLQQNEEGAETTVSMVWTHYVRTSVRHPGGEDEWQFGTSLELRREM